MLYRADLQALIFVGSGSKFEFSKSGTQLGLASDDLAGYVHGILLTTIDLKLQENDQIRTSTWESNSRLLPVTT